MRTLVVEDSKRLAESIRAGLRRLGHAVDVTHDGKSGLSYARTNPYDVIVLDLMLPELDGSSLLRQLRESGRDTYVLVLSAKDTVEDRVEGIRGGADDYLVKPFAFDELVARIEALGRRRHGGPSPTLTIGDLEIDAAARRVTRGGREIVLTAREFALLLLLAGKRGKVLSRIEIEDHLYDEQHFPASNTVESAMSLLRRKLHVPGRPALIETRRGQGYVLDASPAVAVSCESRAERS